MKEPPPQSIGKGFGAGVEKRTILCDACNLLICVTDLRSELTELKLRGHPEQTRYSEMVAHWSGEVKEESEILRGSRVHSVVTGCAKMCLFFFFFSSEVAKNFGFRLGPRVLEPGVGIKGACQPAACAQAL